jgi:hypothetical protein
MNYSFFGNAAFMGAPANQVPLTVEFHDEFDINHVIGCKKCKRKKKKSAPYPLPTVPIIYPAGSQF